VSEVGVRFAPSPHVETPQGPTDPSFFFAGPIWQRVYGVSLLSNQLALFHTLFPGPRIRVKGQRWRHGCPACRTRLPPPDAVQSVGSHSNPHQPFPLPLPPSAFYYRSRGLGIIVCIPSRTRPAINDNQLPTKREFLVCHDNGAPLAKKRGK